MKRICVWAMLGMVVVSSALCFSAQQQGLSSRLFQRRRHPAVVSREPDSDRSACSTMLRKV
jgi:hypothetical protein